MPSALAFSSFAAVVRRDDPGRRDSMALSELRRTRGNLAEPTMNHSLPQANSGLSTSLNDPAAEGGLYDAPVKGMLAPIPRGVARWPVTRAHLQRRSVAGCDQDALKR